MIIDVHCHYTLSRCRQSDIERFSFEPAPADRTTGGAYPTDFDSCISPRVIRKPAWRIARRVLGLGPPGEALDRQLVERYEQHLLEPGPVERFVLLAFDAVHDDGGHVLPLPERRDASGSDIYTSNSLIRALCRRRPDRFLFGASVHPYRPEALAAIDEVFRAGACLMKWLPLHHNIDVTDERTLAALRKCAEIRLPVLIHMSEEFTLTTQYPQYRSIRPLLAALRQLGRAGCMPPVIVAHVATPVTPWGEREDYELLIEALVGEFRDAPLYADISALLAVTKARFLRTLARRQDLHHKLLFGSDFPVPVGIWALRRDLGRAYRALRAVRSWPQQAACACRTLGLNEIVFHRAGMLLPNIGHFAAAQTLPS